MDQKSFVEWDLDVKNFKALGPDLMTKLFDHFYLLIFCQLEIYFA